MARVYHYEDMRTARLLAGCAVLLLVGSVFVVPAFFGAGGDFIVWAIVLIVVTVVACFLAIHMADDAGWWFEFQLQRRFRSVAKRKGLTDKDDQGRAVYPKLSQIIGNEHAVQAVIRPLHGQSVIDWEKTAKAFELSWRVMGVRFSDLGDGTLMVKAGYQPLEARELRVPEDEAPWYADHQRTWRDLLQHVAVGTTEGGEPYFLPFLDTHVLAAGITGAGKGSVIWSLLLGLRQPWKAGVVQFWGVDPKRMELSFGRAMFDNRYAGNEEAAVALVEKAKVAMLERADAVAGKTRRVEPSEEFPVQVVVIDELGYLLKGMSDRKLKERFRAALTSLLFLGRAVGFVVVAAVQDPRKENLDQRDLFPTRIAMKLDKPMVDLVLGAGMYEAGAQCDNIPPRQAGAGVAFVKLEESGQPVCVRFNWCPDELIKRVVGELPPPAAMPKIA